MTRLQASEEDSFPTCAGACLKFDGTFGKAESFRQKSTQRVVGGAVNRRRGNAEFQRVAMGAGALGAPGIGLNMNRKDGAF